MSNRKKINFVMNNYGNLNKDKIILFYEDKKSIAGFGSEYVAVLEHIYWADLFKFTFVESCDEDRINNASISIFEYYEPLNSITIDEVMKSYCVIDAVNEHRILLKESVGITKNFFPTTEYIDLLANIHKKYLQLKKDVKIKIENDIANLFRNKKTIGVHVRGSDYKIGFKDHPVAVDPISQGGHIDILKKHMNEYGFEQIFLATDEVNTIDLFKKEFGEKVVYFNDVFRVTENWSPGLIKCDRENNEYLLGFEVLRDMYALANCEGLIAGLSNVSTISIMLKKTFGENFEFLDIINKGFHGEDGKDPFMHVYRLKGMEDIYTSDKKTSYQKYYELLLKWFNNKKVKKNIDDYFNNNKYEKVAIYGFGTLGKLFYDEVKKSNIQVCYFIDKNADKFSSNEYDIAVIEPKKNMEQEKVDCIVVSPIAHYRDIYNMLKNEFKEENIVSLEDIVE